MERLVKTTHLEMTDRSDVVPFDGESRLDIRRSEIPCPELNRFFYAAVGARWWWYSRVDWTYEQWLSWVDRPELETWIGYWRGTPVGYFELESQPGEEIELAYFGLLPAFISRGLGSELLAGAIGEAWAKEPSRLWVHTCTLDHPRALPTYLSHGFRIFKTEERVELLPDEPLAPWPSAYPKAS